MPNIRHSAVEPLQLQVGSSWFRFEGTTTTIFAWEKLEREKSPRRSKNWVKFQPLQFQLHQHCWKSRTNTQRNWHCPLKPVSSKFLNEWDRKKIWFTSQNRQAETSTCLKNFILFWCTTLEKKTMKGYGIPKISLFAVNSWYGVFEEKKVPRTGGEGEKRNWTSSGWKYNCLPQSDGFLVNVKLNIMNKLLQILRVSCLNFQKIRFSRKLQGFSQRKFNTVIRTISGFFPSPLHPIPIFQVPDIGNLGKSGFRKSWIF